MSSNPQNRSRVPKTGSFIALLLAAAGLVHAQTPPEVEATVLDYMKVTQSFDTQKMSQAMHPEALRRFRATIETALKGPKKAQAEKELLPLFAVQSAEEFAKLSDFETYKRLNDTVAKSSPELVEMMSGAKFDIVGSVLKENLAYVTYKFEVTANGKQVGSEVVQTLKMHEGKWMLMLPSTAEASIAGIEARFQ